MNNDISFYPGILKKLSKAVTLNIKRDPKFGIGFATLCCGGEWSAFTVTRNLIQKIGLSDENIFPLFYEDNDFGVRIHLSGYHAVKFQRIPMMHGLNNGRKKYISGTMNMLNTLISNVSYSNISNHSMISYFKQWNETIHRGKLSSENYLVKKWGFQVCMYKYLNHVLLNSIVISDVK